MYFGGVIHSSCDGGLPSSLANLRGATPSLDCKNVTQATRPADKNVTQATRVIRGSVTQPTPLSSMHDIRVHDVILIESYGNVAMRDCVSRDRHQRTTLLGDSMGREQPGTPVSSAGLKGRESLSATFFRVERSAWRSGLLCSTRASWSKTSARC